MDHRNSDCIVVIVLSHGEAGRLEARDGTYDVNEIWEPLIDCPTLVGKPKLFFIQACRGEQTDPGVRVMAKGAFSSPGDMVDSIGDKRQYFHIPSMADLLVMFATYEGHYAWRNVELGSCFIQALCNEFDENGKTNDLLRLLTGVNKRVAFTFQSNVPNNRHMHAMKQMPCIVSMLTKTLHFTQHGKESMQHTMSSD